MVLIGNSGFSNLKGRVTHHLDLVVYSSEGSIEDPELGPYQEPGRTFQVLDQGEIVMSLLVTHLIVEKGVQGLDLRRV